MGSFFAGIKAGTLGGFLFIGGIAIFNVILLYALEPAVLNLITSQYPSLCTTGTSNATSNVQQCFSSVISVDVPYLAFASFFVVLAFAGIFGLLYDSIPITSATVKGEIFAAVTTISLFLLSILGFFFDLPSSVASGVFIAAWTVLFGYLLGRLYKRYTRIVSIDSQDANLLKVKVDGRDLTGKTRTFALTSSHRVRAEVTDDASFTTWEVTGGLNLEDPRSFETVMEINGEGTLKGIVTKKY
jgi:FlaA1/EpsC-like NDP-sugar epimerase